MPSSATPPLGLHPLSLHDALPISHGTSALPICSRVLSRSAPGEMPLGRTFTPLPPISATSPTNCLHVSMFFFTTSGSGDWNSHTDRSEEHTSELQSLRHLVCRLLLRRPSGSILFPYTTLFRSRTAPAPCRSAPESYPGPRPARCRWAAPSRPCRRSQRRARRTACTSRCSSSPRPGRATGTRTPTDRKSTRLNSSHLGISYAVFCYAAPRAPSSFPTRRSSDLARHQRLADLLQSLIQVRARRDAVGPHLHALAADLSDEPDELLARLDVLLHHVRVGRLELAHRQIGRAHV